MKYPMCLLSHVITPGQYCVITCDKEHVSEVIDLEEKLEKEALENNVSQLTYQMCVAVRDSEGKLKRGVIENKIKQDLYEVLLIDYGKIVQANISQIKVIPERNFEEVEPLAFIVKLYGIVPTKYVSVDGVMKARACQEWRQESKVFVENLFKDYHKIVVQSIVIQERIVYGDIFVQSSPRKKFVSLRKLLCKNEFCAYSETFFLHHEGLDSFSEKKMKFVKKWQKENFGAVETAFNFHSLVRGTDLKDGIYLKQESETSEEMEEISKGTATEPNLEQKKIGMGRGKIKLLIAEMNKKVTSGSENSGSFNSESHRKVGSKAPIGRGKLLRECIESRKVMSSSLDISRVGSSQTEASSIKTSSGTLSSIEPPFDPEQGLQSSKSTSGRAVRRSREFPKFSDSSELLGESLSANDEPPSLIRNVKPEEELESTVVGDENEFKKTKDKCLIKTTSVSSKGTCESDNSGKKEKRSSSQEKEKTSVENLKLKDDGSERIISKERPSNQIPSSSCWAPYVLFEDSVVEPVKTFTELPIKPSVIKNLEKGGTFGYLSQVQRWAIPAIRKQLNTIVIGSPKTGKTLSYIVPLIDYVQDESYFEELPDGNGPTVVIVASSSGVCESIYKLCHSLLGNHTKYEKSKSKVKVVLAHGGGCEKEVWVSLTNGCDILISTPPCIVRLLEMPVLTNFDRLTCLVLDEVDIISQNPFRKHTRIILEKAQFSARDRHFQKIFCGEKWTRKVQNLAKTYVNSYALVIGSYSEAVVYEGLKPCIYLVNQNEKLRLILEKLKDLIGEYKILVVCERTSEANSLNDFFTENGISPLLAHDSKMADKLNDVRDVWKSSREALLIATDGVLTELDVNDVEVLVHFALPSKSKTNFYLRYSTMKSFLRDKRKLSKSVISTNELKDIILIDDENHHQLPHIVDFVVRLGGKVPTKILDKCQEIRRQIEIQKNSPVCENLLSFGRCRNQRNCSQRHAFVSTRDSPGRLPTSGWVNFVVLSTRNASCFSVRLLEHVDASGRTLKWEDHHLELLLKISEFYKTESNRRSHGTPEIGDVCAVKMEVLEQEVFYRAKVIEYLAVDKHEKAVEVKVWLLDRGDVWKRKSMELYELSEELSSYPPVAVDVRILGLQPMDFDVSWSQIANNLMGNLMTGKLEEGQYWSGKIVLAMENTLFLNPIKRKQYLPHLNAHAFDLIVHDELLNSGIAVLNNEHVASLLKLCAEGGIEMIEEGTKAEDTAIIQPQWAFFDEDFIEVKFLAAEHTSTVFLQPSKFEKVLAELEEKCQKEGEKTRGEMKDGKGKTVKAVAVGMFCLALFEDGKWNRGRIESENENEFYVFFVDHGDFMFIPKVDVLPISQALLLRLPCQAIECRLVGIEEKEECPMEVLEKIYEFSEDGKLYLHANIVRKDMKGKITNGRKYSLNLVNGKGISLNKMLVDCGMASAEKSEVVYLKDVQMDGSDVEKEEEKEEEEEEELKEEIREEESPKKVDDTEISKDSFEGFADELFEDDVAQEFLKEFASKVLNVSEPFRESLPAVTDVNVPPNSVEGKKKEVYPKEMESVQNVQRLLDLEKKRRRKTSKIPVLKGREKVLTPQVLWCQNQMEVQMKIMLGSVEDFCLECTVNNISFRCVSGGKFYGVDLRLYGAINPEKTKVTVKTFQVVVVLTKLTFPLWARLQMDEGRLRWVNLDVESLLDKEGVFSDKIKAAKLEVESGLLKKGFRGSQILPCSDSEDSCEFEGDSDSEDSDQVD